MARSVGQQDSKQKGTFVESPFLGFCIVSKGAKGVNGFASAELASEGLGKGPCPPFRLMDWKGITLEPDDPQFWHLLWLGRQRIPSSHLLHSGCYGEAPVRRARCPSPARGWGTLTLPVNHRRKLVCHCRGKGSVGHKCFSCSEGCSREREDFPGDPQNPLCQSHALSQQDHKSSAKNASKPE